MVEIIAADINGSHENSRQIETLLIDLDDTLYQVHKAPELVRENIQGIHLEITLHRPRWHRKSCSKVILCCPAAGYMKTALKIAKEDIQKLCLEYYTSYGTTMAGLVVSKLQASTPPIWIFQSA
jgi:hypothetical protein